MSDRMGQTNGCAVARGDTHGILNALAGISFQLKEHRLREAGAKSTYDRKRMIGALSHWESHASP